VELRDEEDAIVLLLCRAPNTDVRFAPSVFPRRRCGDQSPVDVENDGLGVACRDEGREVCTGSREVFRVCCDEDELRLKRNIAACGANILCKKCCGYPSQHTLRATT